MKIRRPPSVKTTSMLFGLAVLVSASCKMLRLGSRELWLDETYSAYAASLRFRDLVRFASGDVHPPLFSMILWAWVRVAGDAQTHLRLFSALINLVSMFAMFFLGRRVLGARWGAYAAALFAFSPLLFVYSLEVRSYSLFILVLICLLFVHWIVAVERSGSSKLIVLYGVLSSLLFYIHYLAIFFLVGLFVHWIAVSRLARDRLLRAMAAALLTLLLIAPGVPLLLTQHALKAQVDQRLRLSHTDPSALSYLAGHEGSHDTKTTLSSIVKNIAVTAGFYPSDSRLVSVVCAVPLVVVFPGLIYLMLVKGDAVSRLLGITVLPVLAGVFVFHLTSSRYVLPLVPILVLGFARVLQYWTDTEWTHRAGVSAGTVLLAIYLAGFYRQAVRRHGHPWQNIVLAVQRGYRPGDTVIFDALYAQVPFDYFARHRNFFPEETGFPLSVYDWWNKQEHRAWAGPVIQQSDLDRFLSDMSASHSKTLWLVLYDTSYYDPRNALLERLRRTGQVAEVALPRDPDDIASQAEPALRLVRVSLK